MKKWGGLILLGVLGIVLMLVPWSGLDVGNGEGSGGDEADWRALEKELGEELEGYLQRLCNARTHVMVHLQTLEYQEYSQTGSQSSKNSTEENSDNGSSRNSIESSSSYAVQMMRSNGNETPLVVRRWMPMISGIAIVIERQSDPILTDQVVRSISTLYQIGSHKISVEYAQMR